MILDSILIFTVTLLAGMSVKLLKEVKTSQLKILLVFSGAYLFSITFTHILPSLFSSTNSQFNVGLLVLIGFFFQLILEYFTSGVEHGHMHEHAHQEDHGGFRTGTLLIALSIHAFMEGSILVFPAEGHEHDHDSMPLLLGILLHKIPAAIALMSYLVCTKKPSRHTWLLLILFSLATPAGLLLSDYVFRVGILDTQIFMSVMALVGGAFLYISTIILFESSPGHSQNLRKLLIILLGVLSAILIEFVV